LGKFKIPIPLVELSKNFIYQSQIEKVMHGMDFNNQPNTLNVHDEFPIVIDNKEYSIYPLYVTLNIHDELLYNCMLYSRASHNLMLKTKMEKLGLEITRPYHDLYYFDSRNVKCEGVIKDLVVTLAQLPFKSIMMDVIVADVPTNYEMLFSRYCAGKLGGKKKMDMTYPTILFFGGEHKILYRETKFSYVVNDQNNPKNNPIYFVEEYMGYCIFLINETIDQTRISESVHARVDIRTDDIWKLYFEGAYSKQGSRARIILVSCTREKKLFS